MVCVTCQRAGRKTCCYGESGKNGYTRGGEHRAACRLKNEENALYKDEVNATDTVALTHVVKATDTINPD